MKRVQTEKYNDTNAMSELDLIKIATEEAVSYPTSKDGGLWCKP